jgi:hypothetical protein
VVPAVELAIVRVAGPAAPMPAADVRRGGDQTIDDARRPFTHFLTKLGSLDDTTPRQRLHTQRRADMTRPVEVPRNRRIWHFEAEPLCNALDDAGAWQTAVRIRVAHNDALRHRPEGTAFDVRPTPEDVAPLNLALDTLRAEHARERRLS